MLAEKGECVQLHLKDSYFALSSTLIMANVDIDLQAPYTAEDIKELIHEYEQSGASFVEFSVALRQEQGVSVEQESKLLCDALDAAKGGSLIPVVYTSAPQVMAAAAEHGAQMVVDPQALRVPGALEAVANLGLAVCLCYDHSVTFKEDKDDPCAAVSEFFYERVDACLNAKIERQRLIIDPMIGVNASVDFRLKLIGRLKTFGGFGLPLSCALPFGMEVAESSTYGHRMAVVSAVALFAEKQGVRIIRTNKVYDIALAINTWHVLHMSARPFKLTRVITKSLKKALTKHRENQESK